MTGYHLRLMLHHKEPLFGLVDSKMFSGNRVFVSFVFTSKIIYNLAVNFCGTKP
jgi:hypothetical protein